MCVVLPFNTFGHLAVLAVYLAVGICLVWRESRKKPFVALPPTTTTLSSAAVNLIYFNGPRVVLSCICGCVCVRMYVAVYALSDLSVIYVDIFDFGLLCSALAAAFVIVVCYN